MKYKVIKNEVSHETGKYYVDKSDELYQLIHDRDQGYALLHVESGKVESDHYESIDSMMLYTTLSTLTPVKQTNTAAFETIQPAR